MGDRGRKCTSFRRGFLTISVIVIIILPKNSRQRWHGNLAPLIKDFMKLDTKYDELANEENKEKKQGLESTASTGDTPNVGTGPVKSVADGGVEGEAKQPKEQTGKLTDMGGFTGGTPGLPDASEGNDNTGSAG